MLVDGSIQPPAPKPKCQGNWCGNNAAAYIQANDVVALLCEQCINKVAEACIVIGVQFKVFDPQSGPLQPNVLDTEGEMVQDSPDHFRLIPARRQIYDGGSFELQPAREQAAIACCDCGLVHILDLHYLDYARSVRVTLRRDKELTAKWRAYRDEQRGATTTRLDEEETGASLAARSQTVEGTKEMEGRDPWKSGRSEVAGPVEDSGDLD